MVLVSGIDLGCLKKIEVFVFVLFYLGSEDSAEPFASWTWMVAITASQLLSYGLQLFVLPSDAHACCF